MATLAPGTSDSRTIDASIEQVVFTETESEVHVYIYPLGTILPVEDDAGVQQGLRVLFAEIDKTLHTVEVDPREKTVDPETGDVTYGADQEVFLVPI